MTRRADYPEWVGSKSNTGADYIALNSVPRFFMKIYFFRFVEFNSNLCFKIFCIRNGLCIYNFVFSEYELYMLIFCKLKLGSVQL